MTRQSSCIYLHLTIQHSIITGKKTLGTTIIGTLYIKRYILGILKINCFIQQIYYQQLFILVTHEIISIMNEFQLN